MRWTVAGRKKETRRNWKEDGMVMGGRDGDRVRERETEIEREYKQTKESIVHTHKGREGQWRLCLSDSTDGQTDTLPEKGGEHTRGSGTRKAHSHARGVVATTTTESDDTIDTIAMVIISSIYSLSSPTLRRYFNDFR